MARVKQINLDDNGLIADVTMTVTVAEAAAIAFMFGQLNFHGQQKLKIADIDHGVYDALSSTFNGFYEDGYNELLPDFDISSINEKVK